MKNDEAKLLTVYNRTKKRIAGLINIKGDTETSFNITNDGYTMEVYCEGRLFGYRLMRAENTDQFIQKDTDNYSGQRLINDANDIMHEIEHVAQQLIASRINIIERSRKTWFRQKRENYFVMPNYNGDAMAVSIVSVNNFFLTSDQEQH